MQPDRYLAHLRADAAALLEAADHDPVAPVPACPDWDVTGLVRHTAAVHHWVSLIIGSAATARPVTGLDAEAPTAWPEVRDWYLEGSATLVETLAAADPSAPVWNWRDGRVAPTRFWFRRMAHETVVHRWDAQQAAAAPGPIDAALALDGIDEFLTMVPVWLAERPILSLTGSLELEAVDLGALVRVDLHRSGLTATWGGEVADPPPGGRLSGPAAELLLWLSARRGASGPGLTVSGDPTTVEAWAAVSFS